MKIQENRIEYIDRPDVTETYANSMGKCFFTEGIANIELCVTRLDKPDPTNPPAGKRYPVCRLALTPQAVIQLFQGLNGIMGAMEKEGIIKTNLKPKQNETQH